MAVNSLSHSSHAFVLELHIRAHAWSVTSYFTLCTTCELGLQFLHIQCAVEYKIASGPAPLAFPHLPYFHETSSPVSIAQICIAFCHWSASSAYLRPSHLAIQRAPTPWLSTTRMYGPHATMLVSLRGPPFVLLQFLSLVTDVHSTL